MKIVKKIISVLIVLLIIVAILYINKLNQSNNQDNIQLPKRKGISNLVSGNGQLYVDGSKLKNMYNENIQLKGLSSHGIQWYSDIITYENLKLLRDDWGINVFRIAMYTNENGYISQPDIIKQKAFDIIDMCIQLDLYVVIDWHILSDGDPNTYINESKKFFDEVSEKYMNIPNLMYEICNEPNQEYVTWSEYIKPYAQEIIGVIRKNSPSAIVLVGTPNWSKNLTKVCESPLELDNVMYTLHFYADSHKKELQNVVSNALSKNIPVFITEWGTTDISGDSKINLESSNNWVKFMNDNNISWINWSFSNKKEKSAILNENYVYNVENNDINLYLTESGQFIKSVINTKVYNPLYE